MKFMSGMNYPAQQDKRLLTPEEMMKAIYPNWLCTPKDIHIWLTEDEYKERRNVAEAIAKAQLAKCRKERLDKAQSDNV